VGTSRREMVRTLHQKKSKVPKVEALSLEQVPLTVVG